MYDSLLSSLCIGHVYVAFCQHISPRVFFRYFTIPTPVLYYLVRTRNIAYLM